MIYYSILTFDVYSVYSVCNSSNINESTTNKTKKKIDFFSNARIYGAIQYIILFIKYSHHLNFIELS